MRTDRRWLHLFLNNESTNAKCIPVGLCICFDPTMVYYIPLSPPLPPWPLTWEHVDIGTRVSRSVDSQIHTHTTKRACTRSCKNIYSTTHTESRRGNIYGSKWDRTIISLVLRFSSFSFEMRQLEQSDNGCSANEWSGLSCVSRHFAFCYNVSRNSRHRVKTQSLWDTVVKVRNAFALKMYALYLISRALQYTFLKHATAKKACLVRKKKPNSTDNILSSCCLIGKRIKLYSNSKPFWVGYFGKMSLSVTPLLIL